MSDQPVGPKLHGWVTSPHRHFCFLKRKSGGEDVFCHQRDCLGGELPPRGAEVKFELGSDGSGRPCAVNVETV